MKSRPVISAHRLVTYMYYLMISVGSGQCALKVESSGVSAIPAQPSRVQAAQAMEYHQTGVGDAGRFVEYISSTAGPLSTLYPD